MAFNVIASAVARDVAQNFRTARGKGIRRTNIFERTRSRTLRHGNRRPCVIPSRIRRERRCRRDVSVVEDEHGNDYRRDNHNDPCHPQDEPSATRPRLPMPARLRQPCSLERSHEYTLLRAALRRVANARWGGRRAAGRPGFPTAPASAPCDDTNRHSAGRRRRIVASCRHSRSARSPVHTPRRSPRTPRILARRVRTRAV